MADDAAIAAWAALGAALLALAVALAQAAQQYAATAQDMKRCEKSVWGPMPGHAGRRVFLWRQLRFRIVFDVPSIFIPTEYWESAGNTRQFPLSRITTLPVPFDHPSTKQDPEGAVQNYSEACWVAFARQVSHVCPSAVRVGLMVGDADRLPADLPVVPMQVSLRDVIALGLMIGMSLRSAQGDSIEMSGPVGFIKSSDHPILGRLLHFSAFSTTPRVKGLIGGEISKSWLRRLMGIASIADQQYEEPKRRYYASLGMRWRTYATRLPARPSSNSEEDSEEEEEKGTELVFLDVRGTEHRISADECETWEELIQLLKVEGIATDPFIIKGPENKPVAPKSWKPLLKVIRKGDLKTTFQVAQGDYIAPRTAEPAPSPARSASEAKGNVNTPDIQIHEDVATVSPKADLFQVSDGQGKLSLDEKLQGNFEESNINGSARPSPQPPTTQDRSKKPVLSKTIGVQRKKPPGNKPKRVKKAPLALEWKSIIQPIPPRPPPESSNIGAKGKNSDDSTASYSSDYRLISELDESSQDDEKSHYLPPRARRGYFSPRVAHDSDDYWRHKQEVSYVSHNTPYRNPDPPLLTFYWASQLDIELGCWATPWRGGLYASCIDALGMMIGIGMAGLARTTRRAQRKQEQPGQPDEEILYAEFPGPVVLEDLWVRLRKGRHTWPPYAINARGGITDLVPDSVMEFPGFQADEKLPQLTLLRSVQSARIFGPESPSVSPSLLRDRLLELASIDFWLSCAAKTNSIEEGKANLISNAPAIIEEIWLNFKVDIMQVRRDRWNRNGGDHDLRRLAKNISGFLDRTLGSPAEHYFVWVGFLRTMKVMQCIAEGPDTDSALSIFEGDILVYLV